MPLRVAFVDLDSTLPNLTTQQLMPRHGVLAVATAVSEAGHPVTVYVECLNGVDFDALLEHDVVGASVTGSNLSRVRELFTRIRERRPHITLLAGGPHATLIPTDVLPFVDVAVRDEGEHTTLAVLAALEQGSSLQKIQGISLRVGDRVVHNDRRPFLTQPGLVEDLSLLTGFKRRSTLAQLASCRVYVGYATASRGCPFPCNFCYENMIGGTGFRQAPVEIFVEDIIRKRDFFGTRRFWLADSNFTTNRKHCSAILQGIIDADINCRFACLTRVDVGRHPALLDQMKAAGFSSLVLGIEAITDAALDDMNKRQELQDIELAISEIHKRGMAVFGLFMVGFDHDTEDSVDQIVDFCEARGVDGLSLYPLTEYPSTPGRTLPRYRICEPELDYYNGHFVTTFPVQMRPSVLEAKVMQALKRFYRPSKVLRALLRGDRPRLEILVPLFLQARTLARASKSHQKILRRVEAGLYDDDGKLRIDRLLQNPVVEAPLDRDIISDWPDAAEAGIEKLSVVA